jgi:mRNA interferase MazF
MATRRAVAFPKRGDVYVVRFDPTEGVEISKTRPAVIIQNDMASPSSDASGLAIGGTGPPARTVPVN